MNAGSKSSQYRCRFAQRFLSAYPSPHQGGPEARRVYKGEVLRSQANASLVDRPFGSRLLCAPKRTDGLRVAFWGFSSLSSSRSFAASPPSTTCPMRLPRNANDLLQPTPLSRPSTYRATVIRSRTTSRLSLVSFLLPTHLLRTTLGPDLRKRNSSPEHGVWRTTGREN